MATSGTIQGGLQISTTVGNEGLNRSFNYTPTGQNYFARSQLVGTSASTLVIGDCGTLRQIGLCNDPANTGTVTVTCAAIIIAPGDVAVFRPSTTSVTLQATATATPLATAGFEV